MSNEIIAVFTFKSREHILSVGGTCSWALNRAHARQLPYAVCMRNAQTRDAEGPEAHGTAFLVGRISDVVVSPENPDRWLITFSEFAEIDVPNAWKGWRNPVRYTSFAELGIDPDTLEFRPMAQPAAEDAGVDDEPGLGASLTIAQAKAGLAQTFGVSPEAVEITIRG